MLLDYVRWAQSQQGKEYDKLGSHGVTVEELKEVVRAQQSLTLQVGDILLVRTGFHVGYDAMTTEEKVTWSHQHPMMHVGVETSRDMAAWLWDEGFSACAGDAPAWERMPLESKGLEGLYLHEVMLAGWGMPIGRSSGFSHFPCLLVKGRRRRRRRKKGGGGCFHGMKWADMRGTGEMWNLERLSEECHRTGRYSFFLTSMPLNVTGAVGSPSNAVAIF